MIELNKYVLPSYWASALVNGDFSGCEDEDEQEIKDWLDRVKPGYCVGCSDEAWFQHGHAANRNQGSDVLTYYFEKL
jgi:hypothetical protein